MADTAPVDPEKQLFDFFGITAVLERFDTLERKVDDLTRLVQEMSTGHARRFDSLACRMDLVERGIRRVENRVGHVEERLDGVVRRLGAR